MIYFIPQFPHCESSCILNSLYFIEDATGANTNDDDDDDDDGDK